MGLSTIQASAATGPVGRDDPGQASRADRLCLVSLGKMSEGELLDVVNRWSQEDGAWADWLVSRVAARLERDYGYGDLAVDEEALAAAAEGE